MHPTDRRGCVAVFDPPMRKEEYPSVDTRPLRIGLGHVGKPAIVKSRSCLLISFLSRAISSAAIAIFLT